MRLEIQTPPGQPAVGAYAAYNAARETSQSLRFTKFCEAMVAMRMADADALFGYDGQPMSKDYLLHRRTQGERLHAAATTQHFPGVPLAPEDASELKELLDGIGDDMEARFHFNEAIYGKRLRNPFEPERVVYVNDYHVSVDLARPGHEATIIQMRRGGSLS